MRLLEVTEPDYANYTNYLTAFKKPPIWRGLFIPLSNAVNVVNPATKIRTSANTTNEYTWLLSNLPSWKQFPKRNRSLICTTDYSYTDQYADGSKGIYAVVLPNTFTLGVCNNVDIWFSFPHLNKIAKVGDMSGFNYCLQLMVGTATSYNDLVSRLKQYVPVSSEEKASRLKMYIDQEYKQPGDALRIIEELLDPTKNRFTIINNLDKIPKTVFKGREVWTSDTCLLVHHKHYSKFRKQVIGK